MVAEKLVGGGETRPLGDERHSARQLCEVVNFSLAVIEQLRRTDEG